MRDKVDEGVRSDTTNVERRVTIIEPLDVIHPKSLGLVEIGAVQIVMRLDEFSEYIEIGELSFSCRSLGILASENSESVFTDDDMDHLRVTYGIPDSVELRATKKHE